jgi:hypothetical protein
LCREGANLIAVPCCKIVIKAAMTAGKVHIMYVLLAYEIGGTEACVAGKASTRR